MSKIRKGINSSILLCSESWRRNSSSKLLHTPTIKKIKEMTLTKKGIEKLYQTNSLLEGRLIEVDSDNSFSGSLGEDDKLLKQISKPLTFGEWLDLKLKEWL